MLPRPSSQPPKLLCDGKHRYAGFHGCASVCRLRVYRAGHEVTVIAADVPENRGTSITNACETLAADVCRRFRISVHCLTWFEYRPAGTDPRTGLTTTEEYALVTFGRRDGRLCDPGWSSVPKSSIDQRIGRPLAAT
jgi:hypothetical protein